MGSSKATLHKPGDKRAYSANHVSLRTFPVLERDRPAILAVLLLFANHTFVLSCVFTMISSLSCRRGSDRRQELPQHNGDGVTYGCHRGCDIDFECWGEDGGSVGEGREVSEQVIKKRCGDQRHTGEGQKKELTREKSYTFQHNSGIPCAVTAADDLGDVTSVHLSV